MHTTTYKIRMNLLYMNLLYSTGNSIQYSIMTYMGTESLKKKKWIYVYVK